MLRIEGVLLEQLARKVPALSTMHNALILTTGCHRTFSVEGIAIGLNTAATIVWSFISAGLAAQTASGIDHTLVSPANDRSTG